MNTNPRRPLPITIISWITLLGSLALFVGAALMYMASTGADELLVVVAFFVVTGIAGVAMAYGLSTMHKWAAYAFLTSFLAGVVLDVSLSFFFHLNMATGRDSVNLTYAVEVVVLLLIFAYQHQMKASRPITYGIIIGERFQLAC